MQCSTAATEVNVKST